MLQRRECIKPCRQIFCGQLLSKCLCSLPQNILKLSRALLKAVRCPNDAKEVPRRMRRKIAAQIDRNGQYDWFLPVSYIHTALNCLKQHSCQIYRQCGVILVCAAGLPAHHIRPRKQTNLSHDAANDRHAFFAQFRYCLPLSYSIFESRPPYAHRVRPAADAEPPNGKHPIHILLPAFAACRLHQHHLQRHETHQN